MNSYIRFIVSILIFPILITIDLFRTDRSFIRKLGYLLLILIIFSSLWFRGYRNLIDATKYVFWELGISDKLIDVPTRGQSMLPTVQDGEVITLHNPKKFDIERGDLVSFSNIETGALNYLKRVVGLEGEQIMLKNGLVYIDNKPLMEDYIYRDAPTYGNTFLTECKVFTIPKGKVAVFGDNRMASTDSRVVGFVEKDDINGVIKKNEKLTLGGLPDEKKLEQVKIDPNLFITKLNEKRAEKQVGGLKSEIALNTVAQRRADYISENFATWKSIEEPAIELLEQTDYDYLLLQEVVTFGNYTEEQLVDHLLELYPYDQDFLSDKYFDIGLGFASTVNAECTIPIVVVLLSWPTEPNYSQDIIDWWNEDINMLTEVISNLKSLKLNTNIDAAETQNMIEEVSSLLNQAHQIRSALVENEWVVDGELETLEIYTNKRVEVQKKLADYLRKHSEQITDPAFDQFVEHFKWGNPEFNNEANNAKLLFGQGKYQEQLESALKLKDMAGNDEESAIGYYWEGLALYKLGKLSQAKTSLKKAVELDTEYAGPYVTLAAISFNEGKYQEGYSYAVKCVELDPNYGWCHNNLGLAYNYLGDKTNAIAELEKAVALDPTSYVFNDNLKRVKASTGN